MHKATQNSGQFVQKPDTLSAREVELDVSQRVIALAKQRHPRHTDQHLAQITDTTVDAMTKALQRGRLRLGYVLMLAATLGPDAWEAIRETAEQRRDACLEIERWATQEHHQQTGDDSGNT